MSDRALRDAVLATARRLVAEGLTRGTSGNVSARGEDGFLITPSGVPYDRISSSDVVEMGLDGAVRVGIREPSSEWRFHRDLYASRPDVAAVVHAHPPFATSIACLRRDLPAVHYEIGLAGGHDVRCAAYATYGTEELSRAVLSAMEGRRACLLANHGLVTIGASLELALRLARTVETVAEIYWRALSVGEPVILDQEEMARVIEKLADYGRG